MNGGEGKSSFSVNYRLAVDVGRAVDICMDIMLAHLLIRLTTYMLCLSVCM